VKAVKEKEAEAYNCARHFQTLECTVLTAQRIVVGPQTRPRPVWLCIQQPGAGSWL